MAEIAPPRRAALEIVSRQRRRGAYARDLLRCAPEMDALPPRGRALASRLVLGSTSASGELDLRLSYRINRWSSLEPRVLDALRLSAFEILYLDTPASISVSQGVELVRHVSPRASGLANAVLRRLATDDRPCVDAARKRVAGGEATIDEMCWASGLPKWLLSRAVESCGMGPTCAMCLAQLEPAPIYVATNHGLHDDEQCLQILVEHGLTPEGTPLHGSFRLDTAAGLSSTGLVEGADIVVSDLGSQAVALIATPQPGTTMLEVGAGRATKTIMLESNASRMGGPADLVCLDSSAYKVRLAQRRVEHGWADHVQEICLDATTLEDDVLPHLPENFTGGKDGLFDEVLIDAPCSGTGTMRRHPEIPWSLEATSVDPALDSSLPTLQLAILHAASSRVAPGGSLTYATCSVLVEENEDVIATFLASPAGEQFSRQPVTQAPGVQSVSDGAREFISSHVTYLGDYRSMPALGSCDGHFCARLVRAE